MTPRAPRIPKRKQNALLRSFCEDTIAWSKYGACAAKTARVNKNTANAYYRHWREIIYQSLRRAPRFFGEVEMDQKSFGGRGRKRMQQHLKHLARKLPHAEFLAKAREVRKEHKTEVFGILQRGGDIYVQIIKKADKRTLIPIVRLVVEAETKVYTDHWRGFSDLGLDGYAHHSVNHSVEYSDRHGTHINGIESFWSFAQRRLAKFNGLSQATLPLHLKECEYRFNHRNDMAKSMQSLLRTA